MSAIAPIAKFSHPDRTAKGEPRAAVGLDRLRTLWVNTGTLCNLACDNCYIESTPTNDRLAYFGLGDLRPFLDEIERGGWGTEEIGFTGGEPFLNKQTPALLEEVLERGYRALVLTNAMKPMLNRAEALLDLKGRFGARLVLRVSLDHYSRGRHEEKRGPGSWDKMMNGLRWLRDHGFAFDIAGRTCWGEDPADERRGYAALFAALNLPLDAEDPAHLVLFPEMDGHAEVPEITTACWGLLGKSPGDVMCATSRMVVRRKGADRPRVVACTLLPYDPRFDLGGSLAEADRAVALNHPYCAPVLRAGRRCLLGGGEMTGDRSLPLDGLPARLAAQLTFVAELDKLKRVLRQSLTTGDVRRENSAEHAWHVALMAPLLAEHANLPVDALKVAKMMLIHDVVEIDAGDVLVYDDAARAAQAAKEQAAADRLFGLLPADQGADLRALWEEYEAGRTPEARFALALDRVQPLMLNYLTGGRTWRGNGVTADKVFTRNAVIADGSEALWTFAEALIRKAVDEGLLPERY